MTKKIISQGIYLVIDPSMDKDVLLDKLHQAISGNIVAVQIWDNFRPETDIIALIHEISKICRSKNIPVLINNRWELLLSTELDGVHFDEVPANFAQIKQLIGNKGILGITCGNELSVVKWAHDQQLDYISFCSIFPSTTANSCELVSFDTIKATRAITSLPIFLAGGIRPENIPQLKGLGATGIAVVSGIMSAEQPMEALQRYEQALSELRHTSPKP